MSNHLKQQIEKIIDETSGDICRVIVRMESSDDLVNYIQATRDAINQRRSMVSARDLVPPQRSLLKSNNKGALTDATIRTLSDTASVAAASLIAGSFLSPIAAATLVLMGREALKPLVSSDFVKHLWGDSKFSADDHSFYPMSSFWSSGSAAMELSRDNLMKLTEKVVNIADIYPNRTMYSPPVFKSQKIPEAVNDHKAYSWSLSRTGALASWGAFNAKGQGIKIAVLDTGTDPEHSDIKGKICAFAEFDSNGATVIEGIDNAYDSGQHGTHCAGVIVGGNASGRWIGMAPDAKIMSALVLKNGKGSDAQILAGIEWAISNGADIISLSLGGLRLTADVLDTYTSAIITANRLGIPVVVAVGNDGHQTTGAPGNDYFAFTVGATDFDDKVAGFSGGRTQIIETSRYISSEYLPIVYPKPEVTAPGVDIYSSVPGGGWETWNGTSMATPHVAGAMALLLSRPSGKLQALNGQKKVDVIQNLLMSTVRELGESGQDHRYGYGRIDVLRALGYAKDLGY
jgi:subtilisin family serine protease